MSAKAKKVKAVKAVKEIKSKNLTKGQKRKFRLLKNNNFEWGKPASPDSDYGFRGHRYAIFVFVPVTMSNIIIEGWAPSYPFNEKTNTDALLTFNKYIESYDVNGESIINYYKVIKEKSSVCSK